MKRVLDVTVMDCAAFLATFGDSPVYEAKYLLEARRPLNVTLE